MHETYRTEQTWGFDCKRCGHHWSIVYEARHARDPVGGEMCAWRRGGFATTPPHAGMPCQRCGGLRVVGHPESLERWRPESGDDGN